MKCLSSLTALLLAGSTAALYVAQQPVSVAYDRGLGPGLPYNADLSLPPFAYTAVGPEPDQITITYQSPTSVVLNWVVGNGQSSNVSGAIKTPSLSGVQSIVQYAPKNGSAQSTATGFSLIYTQNYYLPDQPGGDENYTSGIINHVALTGLEPNTEYYYKVGDGQNFSYPSTFTTLQAVGPSFETYRIGVVADVGLTDNSTVTFQHLTESLPDLVLLVGDFTYSDNLFTDGEIAPDSYDGPAQTYQPNWDHFMRWWSTLTSRVPFLGSPGNHEYEEQVNNYTFVSYEARYNQTSDLSGSGSSRYYSVELPGMHLIVLSPYNDYNESSAQYEWLQKDLKSYNRTQSPWLAAMWHAPWVNTYVSHYKEVECMRLAMEPLLYQYGVDVVFAGHVHAYERSNRFYDYNVDPCGPVYITIGDAGNMEQLSIPSADQPGQCPAPSKASSTGSDFQGNCQWYSFQHTNISNVTSNGYCTTEQPLWSAFREASFGHGTLDVSETQLVWEWHRNEENEPTLGDSYVFLPKDPSKCPNAVGPAPTLAPSVFGPTPAELAADN